MTDIEFLKELQKTMLYENEHDYDSQAHPRFWVLMDYRNEVGNPEYDDTTECYFHNDGDSTQFKTVSDLIDFMEEYHHVDLKKEGQLEGFDSDDLDAHFNYVSELYNEEGYFCMLDIKEQEYIVPDTMFLTKEAAKRHIKYNQHNLTSKVHTYAMTAYRSPEVERLINILHTFDFDQLQKGEGLL